MNMKTPLGFAVVHNAIKMFPPTTLQRTGEFFMGLISIK